MHVLGAVLVGAMLSVAASAQEADPQELFKQGYKQLQKDQLQEARASFEAGLKLDATNALGWYFLGEVYTKLGETKKATAAYRRSLQEDVEHRYAAKAKDKLKAAGEEFVAAEVEAKRSLEAPAKPKPAGESARPAGSVFRDCDVCPELVVIPPGSFVMGSAGGEEGRVENEGPVHTVSIAYAMAVGKYEVTFDEWDACVRETRCGAVSDQGWGRGKRPAINVDYEQAAGYAAWLSGKTGQSYRLLTESEWEYVARAGTRGAWYWGDSPEPACQFANVANPTTAKAYNVPASSAFQCEDGFPASTAPAGTYQPNAFGLYDMMGNVWEWVQDCYVDSYAGAPSDGSAVQRSNCEKRVIRGGSWGSFPRVVRSARRSANAPTYRLSGLGFRVARTLR